MCGISGIVNKNKIDVDPAEIKKINELIKHRGPDSDGFYFEKNLAFGHRRLSILDLSKDGHQPMLFQDKYVITYNGEVYNYLEIRKELEILGYKFNSNSDTEVILASYDQWGDKCVNKFNGMWAFAIHDKVNNIVFCSRDRFGIKPFYFFNNSEKFAFGSEIKQLLDYTSRTVNRKIVLDYLVIGLEEHTNQTFFNDIFKLDPSHNLIFDLKTNEIIFFKYYKLESKLKEKKGIKEYESLLVDSIKLRLRSDVKVGSCLSGGLDSSSIACIAGELYSSPSPFQVIHAKSSESNQDESVFAKLVAEKSKLDLSIIEPKTKDFLNTLDEVIYTQEEPFGSPSIIMQYFVMQKAKELGCKVMLDGQGGDETLLGYEKYFPAYLFDLGFLKGIKGFFNASKNSKISAGRLLGFIVYFTSWKVRIRRLKHNNRFIKKEYLNILSKDVLKTNSKNYLNIKKLQMSEIFVTQMPHLLKYEDKNSMRNSIEARLPFIDYKVLEAALSLESSDKIKNGWTKYALRKAVENKLPSEVVWRKNKFGFEAPTKTWLTEIDKEITETISNSSLLKSITKREIDISKLNKTQKWRYFNLAKWEEIYKVKF